MSDYKRCRECGLPDNMPRLRLDKSGVLSLCNKEKKRKKPEVYKGVEALKGEIDRLLSVYPKDRRYDCIVGCSGGRDSTYLLYWVKNVLELNVLAVTMTHDFMPERTLENVKTVTSTLGIDTKYIENRDLNVCGRKSVQAWAKKPSPEMLVTFCTGCRYGLRKAIPGVCQDLDVPLLFMGNTRLEKLTYRTDLLSKDPDRPSHQSMKRNYPKILMKHLAFFSSPRSLYVQYKDFASVKKGKEEWPVIIKPFFDYVEWEEDVVIPTIRSLGWGYDESLNATWRSDCFVNLIRQYYYKRFLGFNDLDVYYARQIRNGLITFEEAENRMKTEGNYSDELIARILKDHYDLDFYKIESKIKKYNSKRHI